jgi:nucleolar pre-ribosomal-associated protein 2
MANMANICSPQARNAQERLSQLEKDAAPISQQVKQAALFADVAISLLSIPLFSAPFENLDLVDSKHANQGTPDGHKHAGPHGRQEWVLRWALKKLAAGKQERACAELWGLLRGVVERVPRRNAARVLNERKFLGLVESAIEEFLGGAETEKAATDGDGDVVMSDAPESGSKAKSKSKSKKRKRDGRLVESESANDATSNLQGDSKTMLRNVIYGVMDTIVGLSRPASLEGEYMKSVLRTSEAAKILGLWLKFCQSAILSTGQELVQEKLLEPFIEVWRARVIKPGQDVLFSNHCVQPVLSLLSTIGDGWGQWKLQLEELLARNVIIPAKTAYGASSDTEVLKGIVGEILDAQPSFGTTLFDIAIRCIQPHPSKRRKPTDTAWLQAIFALILESIAKTASSSSSPIITSLLQSCIAHQVTLDLPLLRSIITQYALTETVVDWSLVSKIVKLDSNTFLIPEPEEDLLEKLFSAITIVSNGSSWLEVADQVVDGVVVPLMGESAKARDLTGFVFKWYAQLVVLQEKRGKSSVSYLSAWEDDALIVKFREVMEPSLTIEQIKELVDWLEERSKECFEAVLVIADAISGAVSKEETIDMMGCRLSSLVFSTKKMKTSFEHRPWRVAARTLNLASVNVNNEQWEDEVKSLCKRIKKADLLFKPYKTLEIFRCLSSMWCMSHPGSRRQLSTKLQGEVRDLLDRSLTQAFELLGSISAALKSGSDIGDERWGARVLAVDRQSGWFACEYANAMLVEYPEVLE